MVKQKERMWGEGAVLKKASGHRMVIMADLSKMMSVWFIQLIVMTGVIVLLLVLLVAFYSNNDSKNPKVPFTECLLLLCIRFHAKCFSIH